MTPFQWIFLSLLATVLSVELWRFWRDTSERRVRSTRILVFGAAATAIALPNLIQMIATWVGISRGADLVLYVFIAAFLIVSFYLYSFCVRLQRELIELVRKQAIYEAEFQGGEHEERLRIVPSDAAEATSGSDQPQSA